MPPVLAGIGQHSLHFNSSPHIDYKVIWKFKLAEVVVHCECIFVHTSPTFAQVYHCLCYRRRGRERERERERVTHSSNVGYIISKGALPHTVLTLELNCKQLVLT